MVSPGKGMPELSIIMKRATAAYPKLFRAFCKAASEMSAANGSLNHKNTLICKISRQYIIHFLRSGRDYFTLLMTQEFPINYTIQRFNTKSMASVAWRKGNAIRNPKW